MVVNEHDLANQLGRGQIQDVDDIAQECGERFVVVNDDD